ncbi:sigma-70 family RNA polymerase sigma factor [Candidatus Parcubacteria bacterium]|nr:sigma-70 family RNA polymerase sigma factor [Candidatus Parcubacteria bacterium]
MTDNEREQFSRIYDQYIEKIYRFVYLKVSSQEVAEDVTSQVFLKGWEAYQKKADIKNPGAFLYQIARNMVVDHYREKGRSKIISIEQVGSVSDPNMDIHQKAVLHADIDKIKGAIQDLKEDYQDVLIWYYLEDMPADQIAQLVGKPTGTVRVMIHRGLQMLKDILVQES